MLGYVKVLNPLHPGVVCSSVFCYLHNMKGSQRRRSIQQTSIQVERSVLAVDIELSEPEGAQLLAAFMASINDIELLYTTSGLDCWGG